MGEHKHKKDVFLPGGYLPVVASVSVFKIVVILFVKFLLFVLRVILFPLGLLWMWENMLRLAAYCKYP